MITKLISISLFISFFSLYAMQQELMDRYDYLQEQAIQQRTQHIKRISDVICKEKKKMGFLQVGLGIIPTLAAIGMYIDPYIKREKNYLIPTFAGISLILFYYGINNITYKINVIDNKRFGGGFFHRLFGITEPY